MSDARFQMAIEHAEVQQPFALRAHAYWRFWRRLRERSATMTRHPEGTGLMIRVVTGNRRAL